MLVLGACEFRPHVTIAFHNSGGHRLEMGQNSALDDLKTFPADIECYVEMPQYKKKRFLTDPDFLLNEITFGLKWVRWV